MQQTMIRAQTKLEFAWGLATKMTEAINMVQPPALQMLGELWAYSEFVRVCIHSSEEQSHEIGNGMWVPNAGPMLALKATLPIMVPPVSPQIIPPPWFPQPAHDADKIPARQPRPERAPQSLHAWGRKHLRGGAIEDL